VAGVQESVKVQVVVNPVRISKSLIVFPTLVPVDVGVAVLMLQDAVLRLHPLALGTTSDRSYVVPVAKEINWTESLPVMVQLDVPPWDVWPAPRLKTKF
jgi:hypothetical protein